MPNLSIRGVDVFYRDEGEGPLVVLGHSSTGSGGQWRDLIRQLSARYRLLAPDHIGYGRTGAQPANSNLLALEINVIETLMMMSDDPVHLIGHSYGGSLVARAALRHPNKVRSLSLIEPTLFHLLDSAGHADALAEIRSVADRVVEFVDNNDPDEAARGFITYWVGPGAFDRMDERVRTAVVAGMAKLRAEWLVAFDGVGVESNAFRQLDVPIQLIRATQTTLAARDVVDVLRNLWPSARFFEVAGAGHMAPLTHPTEINGLLADFLHQIRV